MSQLVQLSNEDPLARARPERGRGARRRRPAALAYAMACVSLAALVAAAPRGVSGNELDPPAGHAAEQAQARGLSVAPVVEAQSPGEADYRVGLGPGES